MIDNVLRSVVRQRRIVIAAVLGISGPGVEFTRLPIDAVPDITNVQVQINVVAPGYSPLEVEQRITFPVETGMGGLPSLEYTRSLSRYGLSQVTVVFNDGTNIYFARQLVNERLQQVKDQLPAGIEMAMGPISTGLGEIFMFTVEARKGAKNPDGSQISPVDLRVVQDWIIKPQLRTVPGIVEVNTIGGFEKQFHVLPDPTRLMAYRLSFRDVMTALAANNANVGAGYIEKNGEQYLVRTPGQVPIADIKNIVWFANGVPVGTCGRSRGPRAANRRSDAEWPGTVVGTHAADWREQSHGCSRVAARLDEIASLPTWWRYATIGRGWSRPRSPGREEPAEGALLVVAILFLLLGNIRAAIATALVIPLSMLITITGMVEYKVSANLMSLGAIDFGIIIDGAVIIVENCLRLLAEEQKRLGRLLSRNERFATILAGAREVIRPSLFGTFIIAVVYLPVLTLSGVEGKMFTPMAVTVLIALGGAAILSMTFVPAAVALLVTGRVAEHENIFMRMMRRLYVPLLDLSIRYRVLVAGCATALVVATGLAASRMGGEFIPSLDEGDIALHAMRIPGTGPDQAVAMQRTLEKAILEFPEVKEVISKIAPPRSRSIHAAGTSLTTVILKPRRDGPIRNGPADLVAAIERRLDQCRVTPRVTQPI